MAQEQTPERKIDPRVFDLYDEYCHGRITRREFLSRAAAMTIGGVSALWMAQALLPRYAEAQTISFTDPRMTGTYVEYPSPGGTSGEMRGYLVQPAGDGPFPSALIIHENRGLNPHIEDVARRAAVAGFLALAPDGLSPVGGYPGNDDDGRTLQRELNPDELDRDMINSARFLKAHDLSNGALGATGFCWGGGMTNRLAVELGSDLNAGVPFYGAAAPTEGVPSIEGRHDDHATRPPTRASTRCGPITRRRCRRTASNMRCTCSRGRCTASTTTRRRATTRRPPRRRGTGPSASSAGT